MPGLVHPAPKIMKNARKIMKKPLVLPKYFAIIEEAKRRAFWSHEEVFTMVTMAQRIEELRTERGLSRPALSAALGFPKNAAEKFEMGRLTPTREQQEKMAAYFGVSMFYLRGESNDRTRQESWIDAAYNQEEPDPVPAPKRASRPAAQPARMGQEQSTVFDSLLGSKAFQELVRATVLEVLRSPEGQEMLSRTVRRELDRQR